MVRFDGALAVNTSITGAMATLIREPISILVLVAYLVASQPLLSLFTLLLFPLCLVPIVAFGRKSRKSNSNIHGKYASLGKILHESYTGIRVIKGYNLVLVVYAEHEKAADLKKRQRIRFKGYLHNYKAGRYGGAIVYLDDCQIY